MQGAAWYTLFIAADSKEKPVIAEENKGQNITHFNAEKGHWKKIGAGFTLKRVDTNVQTALAYADQTETASAHSYICTFPFLTVIEMDRKLN